MHHYGDIVKLKGNEVPIVDIICGGSPCQDLSTAGKRAGLTGARSGLFMEQIRLIKEIRNESIKQLQLRGADYDIRLVKPRYMVWENVDGARSSGTPKGEDFRIVLEETAKIADANAIIPRLKGGGTVVVKWLYIGRWVVNCLESSRCTVLGSAPTKKTYRSCRRFWRTIRTRNII